MTTTASPQTRRGPGHWLILVLAATGALFAPLAMALALRIFVMEAYQIPSGALEPTLLIGDHIFVRKLLVKPNRGEVVVFRHPLDPEFDYIERVVAVAGDTIEFRGGRMLLNGAAVKTKESDESCGELAMGSCTVNVEELDGHEYKVMLDGPSHDTRPVRVPPGHFFAVGDNRNNSNDSRVWGFVPEHLFIGRASFIWWSSSRAGEQRWSRLFQRVP